MKVPRQTGRQREGATDRQTRWRARARTHTHTHTDTEIEVSDRDVTVEAPKLISNGFCVLKHRIFKLVSYI